MVDHVFHTRPSKKISDSLISGWKARMTSKRTCMKRLQYLLLDGFDFAHPDLALVFDDPLLQGEVTRWVTDS